MEQIQPQQAPRLLSLISWVLTSERSFSGQKLINQNLCIVVRWIQWPGMRGQLGKYLPNRWRPLVVRFTNCCKNVSCDGVFVVALKKRGHGLNIYRIRLQDRGKRL